MSDSFSQSPRPHSLSSSSDDEDEIQMLKKMSQLELGEREHEQYMGTGFIYDPVMAEHKCEWDPNYPENPKRITEPYKRCNELGLVKRCQRLQACYATEDQVMLRHAKQHVEIAKSTAHMTFDELVAVAENYHGWYSNNSTYEAALMAAGSTLAMTEQIIHGKINNGFAMVRPPGHHAGECEFNGFCTFNNVALATQFALDRGIDKILIVDWDVHHGQGVQRMFYDDPRVLYFSIHRYEYGHFWPNLRESDYDYVGKNKGEGFNINIPLNKTGMTDSDYMAVLHQVLLPVAYEFCPQLILISSGYDAAVGCPEFRPKLVLVCSGFDAAVGDEKFGRTETIQDNLNPEFAKKFIIDYFFEEAQKLKFEVYDVDSTSRNLDQHDFIGSIELTLGEIVGSSGGSVARKLRSNSPGNSGEIILRAEELSSCKEVATFHFKATHLDQKNWWGLFGKSDPFLTFYRANEDNSYTVVHRTEEIKNTLNPDWKTFTIPVKTLCNGDYDRSIKVECHDWNASGSHELIGNFITNFREMSSGSQKSFELHNPKSSKKKKAGVVHVVSCYVEQQSSFIDYIRGGMQMNFTVAIDFTASNGNPQNPTSLHYYNPYQLNQYAAAISAVGQIIQDYDSDKLFPALGFGARMPDGSVSHEFALNFQPQNPFCAGIDGVLAAYYHSLNSVQLYGPTNFAPVINHVARFAAAVRDGTEYFVLLIITDGIITDMPQTKSAIVSASTLPMSIIIVGVGDADFGAMDILDGDDVRLSSQGRYAERDIVQFVPFRNFLSGGGNMHVSQAFLAKEVLAEIPDQVLSYMKRYNIKPKPPVPSVIPEARNPNMPPSQAVHPYPPQGNVPNEPPPPYKPY